MEDRSMKKLNLTKKILLTEKTASLHPRSVFPLFMRHKSSEPFYPTQTLFAPTLPKCIMLFILQSIPYFPIW